VLHRPWHELGGTLSERMRWLERVVLGAAFVVGCFVGAYVRDRASSLGGRSHLDSLRRVWIPPAAISAAVLVTLQCVGQWPWILLVLTGFVAYWAGLDAAVGAWPLVRGDVSRPAGRIEPVTRRDLAGRVRGVDNPWSDRAGHESQDLARGPGHRGLRQILGIDPP
jgi:hypothetical protein